MRVLEYIRNLSELSEDIAYTLGGFLPSWAVYWVLGLLGIIAIMAFVVPSQLAVIWIERRAIGRIQVRWGPNRVGPYGLLQPIADALKLLAKEAITPARADKWVFWLAPILFFVPGFLIYAVLPFGPGMIFSDLNIGILYVVAVSSLSAIMVFIAGWSSDNKYSLLGSMRAVAMMVSYEIPMVLSVLGVVLLAGSLKISDIVEAQLNQSAWFFLLQPLGFIVFFIAAISELNRTPMDIMEAESEIVAGYHTEYSGMKFGLFYAAEYTSALAVSGLLATLFFGGWGFPYLDRVIPPWILFIAKLYFFFMVLVWIRGTWPRLRIDQLMDFAWKFLLPLALANIFLTALEVLVIDALALSRPVVVVGFTIVNFALAALLVVGMARLLDKRRIIT